MSSEYNQVRQTPMAYAPDSFPTAPCFKSFSAGASSPFFGAALGGGKIDKGCDSRETARSFALMHNFTAAAKILCSTNAAKRAKLTTEDCLALAVPVPEVIGQVPTVAPVVPMSPVSPVPIPASTVPEKGTEVPVTPIAPMTENKKISQ
jgi:hypothetical protein